MFGKKSKTSKKSKRGVEASTEATTKSCSTRGCATRSESDSKARKQFSTKKGKTIGLPFFLLVCVI